MIDVQPYRDYAPAHIIHDYYRLMQKGNIIMGYIVPCFDVLHSFSREYIIEDLTGLMRKKGLLAA